MSGKQTSMRDFYKEQRGRGRPKKKKEATPNQPKKPPPKPKAERKQAIRPANYQDWTKGENLQTLLSLIYDWDHKEGAILLDGNLGPIEKVSLNRYTAECEKVHKIKASTLKMYLKADKTKRKQPGGQRGRTAHLNTSTEWKARGG